MSFFLKQLAKRKGYTSKLKKAGKIPIKGE